MFDILIVSSDDPKWYQRACDMPIRRNQHPIWYLGYTYYKTKCIVMAYRQSKHEVWFPDAIFEGARSRGM